MNDPKIQVQTVLRHILALAERIGPRGATSPEESKAAQYAFKQLEQLGYHPYMEHFSCTKSTYQPHVLASILMLIAFLIYPLAGRVSAALAAGLSFFTLFSI